MIYLSAQPDEAYFAWQLEIQLSNFKKFGIKKEMIHVLIGYNPDIGLNYLFIDLINRYENIASFFYYPDNRKTKRYAPSIRPHIIKQHFKAKRSLNKEVVFYHDCDIIFTTVLPDFERIIQDDSWHFSDTRSYLDSKFIMEHGTSVFKDMCDVVGIDAKLVIDNDESAGGAQALIKYVNYTFWEAVEKDSENLYVNLIDNGQKYAQEFSKQTKKPESEYKQISAWCADMWALFWNALKINASIKIEKELDFCWPHYPNSDWNKHKIFHNAGVDNYSQEKYFYKANFLNVEPFDYDFSYVEKNSCSYNYLLQLNEIKNSKKYLLSDATFYFLIDSKKRLQTKKLYSQITYLLDNFVTNILVIEFGDAPKINLNNQFKSVTHVFHNAKGENPIIFEQKSLAKCSSTILFKCDTDCIASPSQINRSILSIRHNKFDICYAHSGQILPLKNDPSGFSNRIKIEGFFNQLVKKISDCLYIPSYRCVAISKDSFFAVGLGSENIESRKLKDQELYILYNSSEYKVGRQEGPLFVQQIDKRKPNSKNKTIELYHYIKSVAIRQGSHD
jgi:hypothetical protein